MKVIDVAEILEHWHAGRRMVELSASLGVDTKTVRKYVAPAQAAGLSPGGPALSREQWAALAADWFPELGDRSSLRSTWPQIEGHREQIKTWVVHGVTVSTIHQPLHDNMGLSASESSLRRWIGANLAEVATRNTVVVLRDSPPAGEEAQVDYGLLGRWFDQGTEPWRRVWGSPVCAVATAQTGGSTLYTIKRTGLQPTEAGWSPPSDNRELPGQRARAIRLVRPGPLWFLRQADQGTLPRSSPTRAPRL
jgi:hypothetical protein